MGVSWLWALCLVESGVIIWLSGLIIWLSGFLRSSIRFHRKHQDEIKELGESVTHWRDMAITLDEENIKLKEVAEELRIKNHSRKQAIDLIATINKYCNDFHDSISPF